MLEILMKRVDENGEGFCETGTYGWEDRRCSMGREDVTHANKG